MQQQAHDHAQDDNDSSLSLYLREINCIPLINHEKEVQLALRAQSGDILARDQIISSHLRFVVNVAKNFQNRGMPLSDIISEGNIGLLHAIERFKPEKGFHFISYAVWWIRQAIMKVLVERSCGIRLPQNRVTDLSQIQKLRKLLRSEGKQDDVNIIAQTLKMDPHAVRNLIDVSREYSSLDAPIGNDSDKTLGQMIQDNIHETPVSNIDKEQLQMSINIALKSLNIKEKIVLEFRFGLNNNKQHSLKEIGEILHLTKERIRQIEKKAIEKLRHPSRSDRLAEFID